MQFMSGSSLECPVCKLINPPESHRCDCGYDFGSNEMIGTRTRSIRINKWGIWSIVLCAAAFLVSVAAEAIGHGGLSYLLVYILLQLSALTCAIIAAVRGSKWWLLVGLLLAFFLIPAVVGLLVE